MVKSGKEIAVWDGILNEKFLVEQGEADSLSEITELDLSGLGLSDSHINPEMFNLLTSLEELILEKNSLTKLPEGLVFSKTLKVLNLSSNSIKNVEWLSEFTGLESLELKENPCLAFHDYYKVSFLLPDLKYINGDKSDHNQIGEQYTCGLKEVIFQYWQAHFAKKYSNALTSEIRDEIIENFIKTAKTRMKYGLSSMKGFRSWRIDALKAEIVEYVKKTTVTSDQNGKSKSTATPKATKKRPAAKSSTPVSSKVKKDIPECTSYVPTLFLQCHSKDVGKADFETQVWNCEFEPKMNSKSGETTSLVASCGGELVCFIDCKTGKIMSKFNQASEIFYCLAWTSLKCNGQQTNVLACGGCRGDIYLIHPKEGVFYGKLNVHSKPVQALKFSPVVSTRLASADQKGNIYLHDIGEPSGPNYDFSCTKLMSFAGVQADALKLVMPLPSTGSYLLASSENGLHCWDCNGAMKSEKIDSCRRIDKACTIYFPLRNSSNTIVDSLVLLKPDEDIVASKCAGEGVIQIWKFSTLLNEIKKLVPTKKKSSKVTPQILCELSWSTTSHCYLNICSVSNFVFAGDDRGSLWVYELDMSSLEDQEPRYIVPFPFCERPDGSPLKELGSEIIFNDIACSSDLKHVTVATDVNIVGLYGLKDE